MRNSIFLLLLCCFIVACSNDKATQAADDSKSIQTDSVLKDVATEEIIEQVPDTVEAQVPDTVMAQAFQNRSHSDSYGATKLDNGMIETFLVPNMDEIVRVPTYTDIAEDTIDRPGTAAIALITRNEPFSIDTLRITRDELNTFINTPDIIKLEICSINFRKCIADTLVFSLGLTIPDTNDGYFIECYRHDKKNRFEWDVIDVSEGNY